MIQLKDNEKTRFYFDERGLARERIDGHNNGRGDSLWYSSLFLIASGNKDILEAVKKQVFKVKGKYRFSRHPEDLDNDTSRDQSIPTLIALKRHNPEFYKEVISNLSFRISGKFTWQDAWFWAKERYGWWTVLSCYHCFSIWFQPMYSVHLLSWMIWHSGKKRRVLRWLLLNKLIPKDNYLLRILLEDKLTEEDRTAIFTYRPRIDFIWQRDSPDNMLNKKVSVLNYIGGITWLLSGIAWIINAVNHISVGWCCVIAGFSLYACSLYIKGFFKKLIYPKKHRLMTKAEAEYNTLDRTVLLNMFYEYEAKLK